MLWALAATSTHPRPRMPLSDPPTLRGARLLRERVRGQILTLIERHFAPGLRLPPMSQIADELSVSVSTVNQAIKELVAEGYLVSRQRAGTRVAPGCRVADIRGGIKRKRALPGTGVAGAVIRVLLMSEGDAMVQEMADSFARRVADDGARVRFAESFHDVLVDPDDDSDATVFFQPPYANRTITWKSSAPLLVVATVPARIEGSGRFDQVTIDDEYGGYLAGCHLRETGHRSVCFVGRREKASNVPTYDVNAARRLAGFERGWGEPVPQTHRLYAGSADIHMGATAMADYMALDPRPEAIFCQSDDLAVGVHIGAFTQRLRAGRDFSLVGFDRQQLAMNIPAGPLTTVDVPRVAIGRRAAELLIDRLQNLDQPVRHVSVGCTFFEGATVVDRRKEIKS